MVARRFAIIALAALFCAVVLASCGESVQSVTESATEFCATHGGVKSIKYEHGDWLEPSIYNAECKDGSEIE